MWTKLHNRRGEFAAGMFFAIFRIGNRPSMAIGIAKMHAGLRGIIELIRRLIITEPIPAVVREPQLVALWLPIESHRVPDPARDHFVTRSIRIDTRDQGIAVRVRLADVAGRSDGHIQLAVRPEGDKFPSMHRLWGKAVRHHDRL